MLRLLVAENRVWSSVWDNPSKYYLPKSLKGVLRKRTKEKHKGKLWLFEKKLYNFKKKVVTYVYEIEYININQYLK